MRYLGIALFLLGAYLGLVRGFHTFPDDDFYRQEIDYVASLKTRLTGAQNHTIFIDYLEDRLTSLGFKVYSDYYEFEYNSPPRSPLKLEVDGREVPVSSYVPYSGNTDDKGVSGNLVHVPVPQDNTQSPDWSAASGRIAVLDLFNSPYDGDARSPVWPGTDKWDKMQPGIMATNKGMRNLTEAAGAGVKGVIYRWMNVSSFNAYGQYAPFKMLYQGVPAVHITTQALGTVSFPSATATLTSTGSLTAKATTRTIYVVVEGSGSLANETVILNTHTDGTNVVEENGHIALLAKAAELAAAAAAARGRGGPGDGNPPRPRRTTILLFVTGHVHADAFSATGRVTERWMADNQHLWAGGPPEGRQAVFASCVEHLGAIRWEEALKGGGGDGDGEEDWHYYPTGELQDENLYASTAELAALLGDDGVWRGADPGVLRVINPLESEQAGEGLPFVWHGIPEVSLVTAPDWLLKVFPEGFDQSSSGGAAGSLLVDLATVRRQTESFLRLWGRVEGMTREELGNVEGVAMEL